MLECIYRVSVSACMCLSWRKCKFWFARACVCPRGFAALCSSCQCSRPISCVHLPVEGSKEIKGFGAASKLKGLFHGLLLPDSFLYSLVLQQSSCAANRHRGEITRSLVDRDSSLLRDASMPVGVDCKKGRI